MTPSESVKAGDPRLPAHSDSAPVRRWITSMEAEGKGEEAWGRVATWDQMVSEHDVIRTSVDGRVGIVELNYPPKANALVPPMYKLFAQAMEEMSNDDEVWVVLITGTGRSFSSGGYVGADAFYAGLDAGHDGAKGEPIRRTLWELFSAVPRSVTECEKPTIAAVNGPVMAESLDIALAADLRTGCENTQFRFSFAATGNTAYTGAAWTLPRLIGAGRARQYLMMAEWVDGPTGFESGLVNYLFPDESFREDSLALAHKLAGLPPITQRLIKKEINLGLGIGDLRSAQDVYSMIEPIVQSTEDHMDAENAVIEKRAPVVRGF
jgi:enoyl-CoA hydratase/carnithine racemase